MDDRVDIQPENDSIRHNLKLPKISLNWDPLIISENFGLSSN